tara:strand:- start:3435 stop:3599 length:165 start_codon:yes stop_codon:yes gene_type:complete
MVGGCRFFPRTKSRENRFCVVLKSADGYRKSVWAVVLRAQISWLSGGGGVSRRE